MLHRRAAAAYQKVSLETSPIRILDALLGRLIEDIEEAAVGIEAKDIMAKTKAIDHALAIVAELRLALDRRQAPELCERLASLYGFVEDRLLLAGLRMDPALAREAKPVVETIRGAFKQVMGMAA